VGIPPHKRGVSRSSRTLSAGCDERGDVTRRMTSRVRRSRVVLASRRWRQDRKGSKGPCERR
jgi:hypothetical protein